MSIRGFSNLTRLSSASLYLDYWSWWCILNNLNCSIKNSLQTFRSPKYRNDKNWTAQTSQLGNSQENDTKQIRLSFQKEAKDKISSKCMGATKVSNSLVGNIVGGGWDLTNFSRLFKFVNHSAELLWQTKPRHRSSVINLWSKEGLRQERHHPSHYFWTELGICFLISSYP